MNDIELEPCPFCGKEPELLAEETLKGNVYVVCCMNFDCFANAQTNEMDTPEEAADIWNKRAVQTCRMERTSWDNGQSTWGCKCSNCGERFEYESGRAWYYCPRCAAWITEVVE